MLYGNEERQQRLERYFASIAFEEWLTHAMRNLATPVAECLSAELRAHYENAFEDNLAKGMHEIEARRDALERMGDAARLNKKYNSKFAHFGELNPDEKFNGKIWSEWFSTATILPGVYLFCDTTSWYFQTAFASIFVIHALGMHYWYKKQRNATKLKSELVAGIGQMRWIIYGELILFNHDFRAYLLYGTCFQLMVVALFCSDMARKYRRLRRTEQLLKFKEGTVWIR